MAHYVPPVQSKFGQIIDVIVLLVLAIGSLFVPLKLGLSGSAKIEAPLDNPTWEALGQNDVMVQRWSELGFTDPNAVNAMITTRFDYSISWVNLIVMVVVVVGYFVMMLRLSDKEYREVVDEKFGRR